MLTRSNVCIVKITEYSHSSTVTSSQLEILIPVRIGSTHHEDNFLLCVLHFTYFDTMSLLSYLAVCYLYNW